MTFDPTEPAKFFADLRGELALSTTGEWSHNGVPFTHQLLIQFLFKNIVFNEDKNRHVIRVGPQEVDFDYDDTVAFVRFFDGDVSPATITLLSGEKEPLRPDTLAVGSENQLYCMTQNGNRARFLRPAHQELLATAVDEQTIEINGKKYSIR